jgi:hypothetical protein
MVQRWRALALMGLMVATWIGCSGESSQDGRKPVASAGKPAAGHGGTGGKGGSGKGGSGGTGGTAVEGGAAGSDGDGGRAAAPITGGAGGRGGSGGMFGTGAFAGSLPAGGGGLAGSGVAGSGVAGSGMAGTGHAGTSGVPFGWNCAYANYGDGKCDCGCGVMDKDCTKEDVKHCQVCNTIGSCNRADCPGHIDPDDITKCTPPPEGWTCTPAAYGDGTTCDCGCGIQDEDCPNLKVSSCQSCEDFGSCANGPCPSSLQENDNTQCAIPDRWTCAPSSYGDGVCHCGCTVVDIDCPDSLSTSCQACDWQSCSQFWCSYIDPDENQFCATPPSSWRCSARLYRDGVQCDCGCGALDPDCASAGRDACDKCDAAGSCSAEGCPGLINEYQNYLCDHPTAPPEWTCYEAYYGDGYQCDCGCGIQDIDCRSNTVDQCQSCLGCGYLCPDTLDPNDPTKCAPPPSGWTCSARAYLDQFCDCGCGIPDPSCQGVEAKYVCANYPKEGCTGGNPDHLNSTHNALCTVTIPSAWTCDRGFFDDGLCDCGCGAFDTPDCSSKNLSACLTCDDEGSCSTSKCKPSNPDIVPTDNAHCN